MVGMISLEHVVVSQRVRPEGMDETAQRPVQDEAVQQPFEERGENDGEAETEGRPEKEMRHMKEECLAMYCLEETKLWSEEPPSCGA